MRLVSYDHGNGRPAAGIVFDDTIVDVAEALQLDGPLADVGAILTHPDDLMARLRELPALASSGPGRVPLAGTRLHSPILQPPSIRDFMAFRAHAEVVFRSRGRDIPEEWFEMPHFYFSNPSVVLGDGDSVRGPKRSTMLDYELELAAVVGTEGRDVSPEDGLSHIAGFMIMNDWSARDIQRRLSGAQLSYAKHKDFATSFGPWFVTLDEFSDRLVSGRVTLEMSVRVNGETWSKGNTDSMHFTIGDLVASASLDSRVVPGDVLCTGTVGGGSIFEQDGQRPWLQPGDQVDVEAELLGALHSRVA